MIRTIGIVEDEFYFRQALKKYISDHGDAYQVVGEAGNGKTGLEMLRTLKPDIAIVDITMPLMNGIELIEQLAADKARTRVILLTGYGEFEYAQQALRMGVRDYLLKPLRKEVLFESLDRVSAHIDQEDGGLPANLDFEQVLSERLAERLIWHGAADPEVEALIEQVRFPTDGLFAVVLIQCREDAGIERAKRLSRLAQEARQDNVRCITCMNGQNGICAILRMADSAGAPAALRAAIDALLRRLSQETGLPLVASVGLPCRTPSEIRRAYGEALAVWHFRLFDDSDGPRYFEPQDAEEAQALMFTQEHRWRLGKLLRTGSDESMRRFVGEVFKRARTHALSGDTVLFGAVEMLSTVLDYAQESHKEAVLPNAPIFPRLLSMQSLDAIEQLVTEAALRAIDDPAETETRYIETVRAVNEYIEAHFSDPQLRLSTIADEQYMSVQYLCSVYKRHMHTTIGDYIFRVRMKHAQKMLEQGAENVRMVALRCGYEDPNYFNRCFRKEYGLSPLRYAAQFKKGRGDGQ